MRRALRAVPYARSAVWTRRLGLAGALLALSAVVLPRHGVDVTSALGILAAGLGCAGLAILMAGGAAVVIWRTGFKGSGRAAMGLLLGGITLAYPGYLAVTAVRDNPAADLSTDKSDPPQFAPTDKAAVVAAAPLAVDTTWLLGRNQQDNTIEPITFDQDAAAAYRMALKTVTQLHWRVLSATAPTARAPRGRIDAVTYSAVMRLPEWVAIRIAPREGRTRIDLRSVAGTVLPLAGNDALHNIQAFADAMEDQDAEN